MSQFFLYLNPNVFVIDKPFNINIFILHVSTCAYEEWEGKERRGEERKRKGSTCATGEKDTLRGTRTHTFCFPGSCPNPVRLEETSQSPFSVDDDVSTLTVRIMRTQQ